jgi:hypothetical protein
LRSAPVKDESNPNSNVIARLPNGHVVRAIADQRSTASGKLKLISRANT